MPDDFTPLSQVKLPEGGGDDFEPIGKSTNPPPEEKPGMLRSAYNFMGRAPGIGATGASIVASALAPETGGLSLIIPALAAGGTAAGISAMQGSPDPLATGITTGIGDIGGGILGKAGQWGLGKLASKFELGKYIGRVGQQLGEIFDMPAMKNTGDIYNALHLGKAAEAVSNAYQKTRDMIVGNIGADTPLPPESQRFLNRMFYNHVPEFKSMTDAVIQNAEARRPNFVSKYSSFKGGKQQQGDLINRALDSLPMTVENAMEYARLLGAQASGAKKGAGGFALRQANRDVRDSIAHTFDAMAPGKNLGEEYARMNYRYAQGRSALNAFGDTEKLFTTGPKGPSLNRVEWQKASNDALESLRQFDELEALDKTIRLGREPGATGKTIGGHVRAGVPMSIFHPGTWLNLQTESPLRGKPAISNEFIRKVLKGTPAAAGANIGGGDGQ